eukprot:XP_011606258.1 PREDICTED: D-beta-hydroxybutyrate dehydrogenase, mitochondrial-like isoform X2 [Takifugu rubripes]
MAPHSALRSLLLVSFSVFLTVALGVGLPAILNASMRTVGLPETSVTECAGQSCVHYRLRQRVWTRTCETPARARLHRLRGVSPEGRRRRRRQRTGGVSLGSHECGPAGRVQRRAGLWAVVNNAGVSTFGEVEFTSMDTYKQVSEVNLWGTIRVTKAVLPLIRRAKGRVVNLASMYGRMGNIMRSPYCISKYGVEAFSDCLRYEMKAWGVKVSVIEPGNFIAATGILTRDVVASTANKLWKEAPSQVKEDYGKAHFDQHMALMRSYCSSGQKDVAPVLDAITDAIRSKHPYTRYTPQEPHWWIRMQLMTHLPGAVSDFLYF